MPVSLHTDLKIYRFDTQGKADAEVPSCIVEALDLHHGGNISTVYEIRCATPDQPVILKIYPDAFHWKMKKELYVYQLLGRAEGLPTPAILWSDDSKELLPQNYMLLTTLKGQLLSHVAPSLAVRELWDVYFQMATLLARVHCITLDAFGYITTRITAPHPTNEAYTRAQFQKKLVEFDAHGGDAMLRRTVEEYVETHSDLLTQVSTPVLSHDDYHEGNVLVAAEEGRWRVTGIVDVENAVSGDPLLDIAKTDYYAIKANQAKREGFLAGYGPRPTNWRERVQLYKLYHALELWDWFAAIGENARLWHPWLRINRVLRVLHATQRAACVQARAQILNHRSESKDRPLACRARSPRCRSNGREIAETLGSAKRCTP